MLKKRSVYSGFSLFEMLVVISIFSLLGILVTQSLTMSIRGSRKSEASSKVRSSLSVASGIIERQLRNANSVTSPCVGNRVDYTDEFENTAYFACTADNIASGSATWSTSLIDSESVDLTSCTITCPAAVGGIPDSVTLTLSGREPNLSGAESVSMSIESRIMLRNY